MAAKTDPTPYPDYLRWTKNGAKKQRKIAYVAELFGRKGWSKGRVYKYASIQMNMTGNEIAEAQYGNLY